MELLVAVPLLLRYNVFIANLENYIESTEYIGPGDHIIHDNIAFLVNV